MAKSWTSIKNLSEMEKLFDPEFVHNQKINCIKSLRTITGGGLKEAKDFFEQVVFPAIQVGKNSELAERLKKDALRRNTLEEIVRELNERVTALEKNAENQRLNSSRTVAKNLFNQGDDGD